MAWAFTNKWIDKEERLVKLRWEHSSRQCFAMVSNTNSVMKQCLYMTMFWVFKKGRTYTKALIASCHACEKRWDAIDIFSKAFGRPCGEPVDVLRWPAIEHTLYQWEFRKLCLALLSDIAKHLEGFQEILGQSLECLADRWFKECFTKGTIQLFHRFWNVPRYSSSKACTDLNIDIFSVADRPAVFLGNDRIMWVSCTHAGTDYENICWLACVISRKQVACESDNSCIREDFGSQQLLCSYGVPQKFAKMLYGQLICSIVAEFSLMSRKGALLCRIVSIYRRWSRE